eukprot:Filipodium_phascolosomae@DN1501_c0_g1_i1.p1
MGHDGKEIEAVSLVNKPHETFEIMVDIAIIKAKRRIDHAIVQSLMAGYFVALSGAVSVQFGGGFSPAGDELGYSLRKFIVAMLFPFGLVCIMSIGAELFTGNIMIMMIGCLAGKTSVWDLIKNWVISCFGNCFGAVFVAWFFVKVGNVYPQQVIDFAITIAEHKVSENWGILVVRGIGCNASVCMALWLAFSGRDGFSRMMLLWPPVVLFVLLNFEHSVANFFFIPIGMMYGAKASVFDFVFKNECPVILGNIIGGGFYLGGVLSYLLASFNPESKFHQLLKKAFCCACCYKKSAVSESSEGEEKNT